jgi:hydrogenase maturation protease
MADRRSPPPGPGEGRIDEEAMTGKRILVIGYGNPGRGDDGLGPALADGLAALGLPGVTVESDYQLSIEHAALAAEHDLVVFADADAGSEAPFYLRPVSPGPAGSFTSHSVSPGEVLRIAHSCFDASPRGYLLGMRAVEVGRFEEGLSGEARKGLGAALEYLPRFFAEQAG